MRLESEQFDRDRRASAQRVLQQALSGNVNMDTLGPALQTLSESSTDMFSTFEDYARDYLKTSIGIAQLSTKTDSQLSAAEQTVENLKNQIELEENWYKDEIKTLEDQLDALLGLNKSILSLSDAISAFKAAQTAAGTGSSGTGNTGTSAYDYYVAKAQQLNSTAYEGSTSWTVDKVIEAFAKAGYTPMTHWLAWGKAEGLPMPSYAVGTDYVPYDMVAQIHQGERIVPAEYNRNDATNEEIVAELKQLRAQVAAMVSHSRKSAETLDRWEYDGMPETRTV